MNALRDTSYEASLLQSLNDPIEVVAYLDAVMELEDPAPLLLALRQVAKAHGMAEVARRAAERVNDFATPGNVNLVCGRQVHWSAFSPRVAG